LNVEHVADLSEVLAPCLDQGQPRVVLDLQAVPLIDSAGLELLVDASESCHHRGGALKLAGPNGLCREIFAITGVGQYFEIFHDTGSAVRSFVS
jgi:anti-sigma B factor antagonist